MISTSIYTATRPPTFVLRLKSWRTAIIMQCTILMSTKSQGLCVVVIACLTRWYPLRNVVHGKLCLRRNGKKPNVIRYTKDFLWIFISRCSVLLWTKFEFNYFVRFIRDVDLEWLRKLDVFLEVTPNSIFNSADNEKKLFFFLQRIV